MTYDFSPRVSSLNRVVILELTDIISRGRQLKPKFHYADFPETSPGGEVSGKSA